MTENLIKIAAPPVWIIVIIWAFTAQAENEIPHSANPCSAMHEYLESLERNEDITEWELNRLPTISDSCRVRIDRGDEPELSSHLVAAIDRLPTKSMLGHHRRFALRLLCYLHPSWGVAQMIQGVNGIYSIPECLVAIAVTKDRLAAKAGADYLEYVKDSAGESDGSLLEALQRTQGTLDTDSVRKFAAPLLPKAARQRWSDRANLYKLICQPDQSTEMDALIRTSCEEFRTIAYQTEKWDWNLPAGNILARVMFHLMVAFLFLAGGTALRSSPSGRGYYAIGGGVIGALIGRVLALASARLMDQVPGPLSVIILYPAYILGAFLGAIVGGIVIYRLTQDKAIRLPLTWIISILYLACVLLTVIFD